LTGIFGYFAKDVNEHIINEMIDGMENEGYAVIDKVINHTSLLGKLDIRKSTEVIKSIKSNDKINIVSCGEIYNENIDDINKSILTLYDEGKLNLLKNLNGSFAAAIYDNFKEKLTLVNDRYGLVKLFYYQDKDYFCFAPKIKPLLKNGTKKSLRKDAIIDFFLFGYLLGDKTFFEHIYQLPPGSILEVSKDDTKLTKYWDYEYNEEYNSRSKEVLIDELATLWQKAVERRIKKDEKIIIPLSGGLDSRAILAAALRCTSKDNIITFTFGDKGSFDFEIGKMVAEKAGVKNILLDAEKDNFEGQYNISMDDVEGMIDSTPFFSITGYKEMKKYGDRFFTGTLIDVLLGRHILSHMFSSDMLNRKILSEKDYTEIKEFIFEHQKLYDEEEIHHLFNPSFLNNVDIKSSFDKTHKKFKDIKNKKLSDYFAVWDYTNRWNKYIYFAVLRNRNLFKYVTMLDADLVDFTLRISPELRLEENLYKQMLVKKYPDLFELPTKTNFGLKLNTGDISLLLRKIKNSKLRANKLSNILIRRNIFQDKNKNYIDYDDLLRINEEYRTYIRRMLEKVKKRVFFNEIYIDEIWRLHMLGKRNYSMLFGLLVSFELFLERFVDEA
jgi:asparagine synthase (glutamine-hydrolysing)